MLTKRIEKKFDLVELWKEAKPATEFNRTTAEMIKEASSQLIDPDRLRRDRDWSYLASRVVGAELYN